MAILFLFLSILEDCGYMVRIAFVMDRVFRHFGLSGKSFIPLLISSGCGVPGIMASKTIERDNDRRLTIMTATFVPCGAKLPVIALMGGVMAGYMSGDMDLATMMAPIMYFVGIVAVLVSAIMLKKTKPFSGKPAPFVMELPAYHIPSAKTVLLHVWERLKGFIIKAGTILFLACVVMWFLSSFGFVDGGFGLVEESADSILAMLGGAIAILFRPLGFGEWQPVAASITGFTAKEAIVSTMGVLANVSEDLSEETDVVAAAIQTWFPTTIAAFTFRNDGTAAPVQKMVLVRYPVSESLRLRCIPDCISVRWSGTWRSCIQRMDYRGSSPFGIHALHAVPSGSIQGSEELHKKLCRGSFISWFLNEK